MLHNVKNVAADGDVQMKAHLACAVLLVACMARCSDAADILQQPTSTDVKGKFFLLDKGQDRLLIVPMDTVSPRLNDALSTYFGISADWVWITSDDPAAPIPLEADDKIIIQTKVGVRSDLLREQECIRSTMERLFALAGIDLPKGGNVGQQLDVDLVQGLMLHVPRGQEVPVTLSMLLEGVKERRPYSPPTGRSTPPPPKLAISPHRVAEAIHSLLQAPSTGYPRAICPLPRGVTAKDVVAVDLQAGNAAPAAMKCLKYYPALARQLNLPVAWRYRRVYLRDDNNNLICTDVTR